MSILRLLPLVLLFVLAALVIQFYDPAHYMKFYKRGVAYYDAGDYENASTEFLMTISEAKLSDTDASREIILDAYMMAAEILDMRLARPLRAIELYKDVWKNYPASEESIKAKLKAASLYRQKLSKPKEAISLYKGLLEQKAKNPQVIALQYEIIASYLKMHEFEQVISDGRSFLEQSPQNPDAADIQFAIADSFVYLEQYDKALEEYLSLIRKYPESYRANLGRFEAGNCYLKLGKYAQALAAFKIALKDYPNPQIVQLRIKETKARMKDSKNPDSLPFWARKKKNNKDAAPPIINPFPEDSPNYKPVRPVVVDDNSAKPTKKSDKQDKKAD